MSKKKIIFISGPTASGKTSTSISLSKALIENSIPSEVVNFDSLLFYKELNIGTAKPTTEEMQGITHHLVSCQSAKEPMNASDFLDKADNLLRELTEAGKVPIFVGGSGFYLRAFIKGMYESTPISEEIREKVEAIYQEKGIEFFREFLKENDPASYDQLHENDHYRNIRAYEHFIQNGTPISEQKEKLDESKPYDFSINRLTEYEFHHIYLDIEKSEHWEIIVSRCEKMVKDGLVQEMKELLNSGFTGEEKPLKSIGYKETFDFINDKFESEKDYIERMAISTRQLAKSQRTFFKKVTPKSTYHPINDRDLIISQALSFVTNN
jgi:tRNA dimethylallyltransferase